VDSDANKRQKTDVQPRRAPPAAAPPAPPAPAAAAPQAADPPFKLHICGKLAAPDSSLPQLGFELRGLGVPTNWCSHVSTKAQTKPNFLIVCGDSEAATKGVRKQARIVGAAEKDERWLLTALEEAGKVPTLELRRLLSPAPAAAQRRASGGGRGAAAGGSGAASLTTGFFQLLSMNVYGLQLVQRRMLVSDTWRTVAAALATAHQNAAGRAPLRDTDVRRSPLYLTEHAHAILSEVEPLLRLLRG